MATPNYDINYNDARFKEVEKDKNAALSDLNKTYDGMIKQSDKYYDKQIENSKLWALEQQKLQNEQTDFAIEKIEQQKDQAKKDFAKESSAAYVDWQQESNRYGANAEQMAAQGLTNTGYSESSQVSLYNTYQVRVTTAREVYNQAVLNYNNAIKDAQLQNSSVLAEIAYEAQKQQLELSLQGFQYKNQLVLDKAEKKTALENTYHERWKDVLNQINTENTLAEQVRQHNEEIALEKAKQAEQVRQFNAQLAEEKRQFGILHPSVSFSSSGSSGSSVRRTGSTKSGGGMAAISKKFDTKSKNTFTKKSDTGKKGGSSVTVDMNSVLKLGFGPISASRLNDLIKSGIVEEYKSGNKLKYRKTASTIKQQMLLK